MKKKFLRSKPNINNELVYTLEIKNEVLFKISNKLVIIIKKDIQ